jgi:hypothetical protein
MTTDNGEWWETHNNVLALARALDDEGGFSDTDEVIDFFEKPWKWSPEWARFRNRKPLDGSEDLEEDQEDIGP